MDVYVARQPIFDTKMNTYGYELLFRKSQNNFYEGTDPDESTASLISNSFLVVGFDELTGGARGFINFPQNLLGQGMALLLPKDRVVIEILETVRPTEEVIEACLELKNQGYILALDDFVLKNEVEFSPLIVLADIIKIEYPQTPIIDQIKFIKKYKKSITFLAEKIETRKEYSSAVKIGYQLFQGYFFSKPLMVNAKEIGALNINLIQMLNELNNPEPDYKIIAGIVESDLDLAYKLLKLVNSVYFSARYTIKSIHQALVHLGTKELRRWTYLLLLRGLQSPDNAELIKTSLIRGKILSLFAVETKKTRQETDYFISGIFSSIDVLLNRDIAEILKELPLSRQVKEALLGGDNEIRLCLNALLDFEKGDYSTLENATAARGLKSEKFMELYLEALRWQRSLLF